MSSPAPANLSMNAPKNNAPNNNAPKNNAPKNNAPRNNAPKNNAKRNNGLKRVTNIASSSIGKVQGVLASQWSNRVVQLSVFAAVMFYIVANPSVFKFMEQFLPSQITNMNQLLVHTVLFAVLMYAATKYLFDPLVARLK